MRKLPIFVRLALGGLFCVAVALGMVAWLSGVDPQTIWKSRELTPDRKTVQAQTTDQKTPGKQGDHLDPRKIFIDYNQFENGGLDVALQFAGTIRDPGSLKELGESIRSRSRLGHAVLKAELDQLDLGPNSSREQTTAGEDILSKIGMLFLYEGKLAEASSSFEKSLELGRKAGSSARSLAKLKALLGIVALRRGEVENCIACVGPSSCIYPIAPEAVHKQQAGSREAIAHFTAYLEEMPGDLRVRWLLNLAYMTLDEYPQKVPPQYLIPLDSFRSRIEIGRFENVALAAGLNVRGPNLAGGSIFDDFTGDGLPDLFTTSLNADRGASFYVNKGDGTFEDRSTSAGLGDQIYALNVTRADFDNDGNLDVLLLRGGWENPMRLSLLRNRGDGIFDDVTVSSGLSQPIACESAAWGDYDNDGFVDVFLCGEYLPPIGDPAATARDQRNRCRLYHNRGNGTFVDVAATAGIVNLQCAKGSAWADYDGDGRLDLYIANMTGPSSRLYHNEGNGKFRDVAMELGVTGPDRAFAVWFWDFDNDGRLDIYVNDYMATLAEITAITLGVPTERSSSPCLYRNQGPSGFEDVTHKVGLDRAMNPMGANFGDIDNDGYLDLYLGTGEMCYAGLVPNLLFKNVDGRRFENVTMSSGTGQLQKGHGISFADYDNDGDLDLFVESGGGVPGDTAYNQLFRNPCHGRHWLKVKLIGVKTNRAALGARIRAVVKGPDGRARSIHRTIGNNSSFGGNSLVELIGLLDATNVAELEISWPTSRTSQRFLNLAVDQAIEITEGADSFKPIVQPRLPVVRSQ